MRIIAIVLILCMPFFSIAQVLTSSTSISITKNWSQQPSGYTYPMNIYVPTSSVPQDGFPVCILLHGNGSNGASMVNQFMNTLQCHILIAPTGYQNSWNICAENSDAPDIDMVNDLVNILQSYSNVNPNKIRILGTSNGAGLANRVFIENNNSGIDIICAIVSPLNEPQYHSGNFYKPSAITNPSSSFCGYDSMANPLLTRKYLSISNDNDNIIPYSGGSSVVGVDFLAAETAAYNIALHKGYSGYQLTTGVTMGSPTITEFSYLTGNVVHIKGNAMHTANSTQKEYVKNYFLDCEVILDIDEHKTEEIKIYPNPSSSNINIKVTSDLSGSLYSVYDNAGKIVVSGKIQTENTMIEIGNLTKGIYLLNIYGNGINQSIKLIKY